MSCEEDAKKIKEEVYNECFRGRRLYGKYKSLHEASAVIREEVDELWDEIKKRKHNRKLVRKEALHVAATAMRLMIEIAWGEL